MSTVATLPFPIASTRNPVRLYLREIRFELLRTLRNRIFVLSTIGFPTLFYLLFGIVNKGATMQGHVNVAKYLLGGYAAFGMVGAALFGIGIGLALDRTSGWLELKRASPMPPLANVLARCVMAMLFSLVIVSILCALGITLAHVHLTLPGYARMLAVGAAGLVEVAGAGPGEGRAR